MIADPRHKSSLDAGLRLPAYRKNAQIEELLVRMNAGLRRTESWIEKPYHRSEWPILLVVGVPRSGTTLAVQLLASRLRLGYCSNLMARFYEAPAVGAALQEELLGDRIHDTRMFRSEHGVTGRIEEPNEFGYFWSRHLGVASEGHEPTDDEVEQVDLPGLQRELDAVAGVFARPTLYKCMLGAFFVPVLAQMPNTIFVHVRRDWMDVAASIYRTRLERLGDPALWWSFRPRIYDSVAGRAPEVQIAAQIGSIFRRVNGGLQDVPDQRRIEVEYDQFVADPEHLVSVVASRLAAAHCPVEKVGEPLVPQESATRYLPEKVHDRFRSALKEQFLL